MNENNGRNPVREVRNKLKLTQQQMADELRTSLMTARRCEYEKRLPGTRGAKEQFQRLAKKAKVKVNGEYSGAATKLLTARIAAFPTCNTRQGAPELDVSGARADVYGYSEREAEQL